MKRLGKFPQDRTPRKCRRDKDLGDVSWQKRPWVGGRVISLEEGIEE